MATRSRLRMCLPSGEAKKPIYCHFDGYPSNMIPLLRGHYNTIEKVRELMALGNLSILAERVKPEPGESHSYERPASGVTIAYYRDRGEPLGFCESRQSYNYVFDGSTWEVE
jgi:hypothetical protein